MLIYVVRKLINNKWMVACLLIGSILASAMLSSVSLYTDGVLQRLLTKDLENSQKVNEEYPAYYYIKSIFNYNNKDRGAVYNNLNTVVENMYEKIKLPALAKVNRVTADIKIIENITSGETKRSRTDINALSDFQEHISIISGSLFSSETQGDLYEVIVSEEAMKNLNVVEGNIYKLTYDNIGGTTDEFKVKVVGVYTFKDPQDLYWNSIAEYNKSFIMDYSLFKKEFVKAGNTPFSQSQWFYALDYHKITIGNMKYILDAHQEYKIWFNKQNNMDFNVNFIRTLEDYKVREKQLKITLWILEIPIIIILAFYIIMVSQLIVDNEKNEIAVLKSRGAKRKQIFISYLIESMILGLITLVTGPPLGLLLCKVIGFSNGFLEFVQRSSLNIRLNWNSFIYSLAAILLFIIFMLIPAFLASRTSIVEFKRTISREAKKIAWQKLYLDLIFLAVAAYGFYRYNNQQKTLFLTGVKGTDLAIDPLLFLTSTAFILGAGLLFLRIYPYIVRFVFWIGGKIWPPVLYVSFIQVGRSGGQEKFLMLFIIFTLSIGIFSANTARTINRNAEDKIAYQTGADITIKSYWLNDKPTEAITFGPKAAQDSAASDNLTPVKYVEPYFNIYNQLSGVEAATKVFRVKNAIAFMPTAKGSQTSVGEINLMGIIPHEFGNVAWFRSGLLDHHINDYLNLMSSQKSAVLLSRSFEKKYGLKAGDEISLLWYGQSAMKCTVYAFVDYWPALNPNERAAKSVNAAANKSTNAATKDFVVVNLSYIQDKMMLEPYEVWLKKLPGVSSNQIYRDMENNQLKYNEEVKDRTEQTITMKNDPLLQGTNGTLTLGFILSIAISTIGFLIYWILSIKKRLLQFGIFRALGLPKRAVTGILACEQILISGTAVLMGIIIGNTTSYIFVRFFKLVYSTEEQILPFKVFQNINDYLKLYSIFGSMLVLCFITLGIIISKIKISQVIKLGED